MKAEPQTISSLVPAIRAVAQWLRTFGAPGAIIGGIAASLLGRARSTVDVDAVVLIEHERLPQFLAAGIHFEIKPRIENVLEFAATSRVLLLKHVPSGVEVDISVAAMPFEEELLERAIDTQVTDISIRLPTVEDLIIMKGVANRARDWADIEGLIDAHPELDSERVLLWSRRFAEIMGTPEVIVGLEKLLLVTRSTSENARVTKGALKKRTLKLKPTSMPKEQTKKATAKKIEAKKKSTVPARKKSKKA